MKHFFFTIHKTLKRAEVSDKFALETLKRHTAYFKRLGAEKKCLMAGPFADQTTDLGAGCYVFTAKDETEARSLADADPFVIEGLYDYRVCEWSKVVPVDE